MGAGDISFQGTSGFTLQRNQPVRENENGTLTSSRTYMGDGSERDAFLALWPRGTIHPSDPRIWVVRRDWDAVSAGPCKVTLHFGGASDMEASYDTGANGRIVKQEMLSNVAEITKGGTAYTVSYEMPTVYVEWNKRANQKTPAKQSSSGIDDFTTVTITAASPKAGGAAVDNPNTFFTISTDYDLESMGSIESEPTGDIWRIKETWMRVMIDVT